MRSERFENTIEQIQDFKANTTFRLNGLKDSLQGVKKDLKNRARESILIDTPVDFPTDFDEFVENKIDTNEDEPKYFPIVLGSHKSHPAGVPALIVAQRIQELFFKNKNAAKVRGASLLVAGNIDSGQNDTVTKFFKAGKQITDKLSAKPVGVLRKKDLDKMTESEGRGAMIRQGRRLIEDVNLGIMPVSLPEASVESGRQLEGGKTGEIKGMITLEGNSVSYLCRIVKKAGYEPLIFFVGNTGENRIYDPITEKVTQEANIKGGLRAIPGLKHIVPPIMNSVVDYPVSLKEITDALGTKRTLEDGTEETYLEDGVLEQYCGERLAQLIPFHERGVYNEPTLLNKALSLKTRIKEIDIFKKNNFIDFPYGS